MPPDQHEVGLPYLEVEEDPQGPTQFPTTVEGREITVQGGCPRCGGKTRKTFVYGTTGLRDTSTDNWDGEPATVICACGATHDRPATSDETGCGAFWTVTLKKPTRDAPVPPTT